MKRLLKKINRIYILANDYAANNTYGIYLVGNIKSKINNNEIYIEVTDDTVDAYALNLYGIKTTTACGSISNNNIYINSVDASINESAYGISGVARVINNNSIYMGTLSAGAGTQVVKGIENSQNNAAINGNMIYFSDSPNGAGQSVYGINTTGNANNVNDNNIFCDCSAIANSDTAIFTGILLDGTHSTANGNIIDNNGTATNDSVVTGIDGNSENYVTANDNILKGENYDNNTTGFGGTGSTTNNNIGA
jgi:hypothetical protein